MLVPWKVYVQVAIICRDLENSLKTRLLYLAFQGEVFLRRKTLGKYLKNIGFEYVSDICGRPPQRSTYLSFEA